MLEAIHRINQTLTFEYNRKKEYEHVENYNFRENRDKSCMIMQYHS